MLSRLFFDDPRFCTELCKRPVSYLAPTVWMRASRLYASTRPRRKETGHELQTFISSSNWKDACLDDHGALSVSFTCSLEAHLLTYNLERTNGSVWHRGIQTPATTAYVSWSRWRRDKVVHILHDWPHNAVCPHTLDLCDFLSAVTSRVRNPTSQQSVLGLILFLLYVADILKLPRVRRRNSDVRLLSTMRRRLPSNRMSAEPMKCCCGWLHMQMSAGRRLY